MCGFSASCRKDFPARVQAGDWEGPLPKAGDVNQERAQHRSSGRRAQAGPPSLAGESEKGSSGSGSALWGPLGLRRWSLWGRKWERTGEGMGGCAPRRRACAESFVLRVFIAFSKASSQGRPRGRGPAEQPPAFQVGPPGRRLHRLVCAEQRSSVIAAGAGAAHLVRLLSGPGLNHN